MKEVATMKFSATNLDKKVSELRSRLYNRSRYNVFINEKNATTLAPLNSYYYALSPFSLLFLWFL